PNADRITSHICEECNRLRGDFASFDCHSIPDNILDYHRWDLSLLSDEAKQYYLPAWIERSIENPQSDYTQVLLSSLDSGHGWFPATPYTEHQWKALELYLEYVAAKADGHFPEELAAAKKILSGEP